MASIEHQLLAQNVGQWVRDSWHVLGEHGHRSLHRGGPVRELFVLLARQGVGRACLAQGSKRRCKVGRGPGGLRLGVAATQEGLL